MLVHGPKQPVIYDKTGEAMKVQLVQPKPKGVSSVFFISKIPKSTSEIQRKIKKV